MERKFIVIESPFSGNVEENILYARKCMSDSISLGESPIASHLLYTQPGILNDDIQEERFLGIEMGLDWAKFADYVVFYVDLGWSDGMKNARSYFDSIQKPYMTRKLLS